MPLRKTIDGEKECPLGKFKLELFAGAYDRDPVEACLTCNFGKTSIKGFDLEKICQCPVDMSWGEYDKLREQYSKTKEKLTKTGFWEYVRKNYKK